MAPNPTTTMKTTPPPTTTTTTTPTAKPNGKRLDPNQKHVLLHLLQVPKLNNGDISKILDVDERTISRRRAQLRSLGHLSPQRNFKGAEKMRPWHLERVLALLDAEGNERLLLKDIQKFLQDEFDVHVTISTISRQLTKASRVVGRRGGVRNTANVSSTFRQQQQQQQQQPSSEQIPMIRLACPFYTHEPDKYMDAPYCQTSWPSVRDVKEHIFRQHMQAPFRCNRCMTTFDDNQALIIHQRAVGACILRDWVPLEGCDEVQKQKIRNMFKGDETSRWKHVFRIVYPHVSYDQVPNGLVLVNGANDIFNTEAQALAQVAAADQVPGTHSLDPALKSWQDQAVPEDDGADEDEEEEEDDDDEGEEEEDGEDED